MMKTKTIKSENVMCIENNNYTYTIDYNSEKDNYIYTINYRGKEIHKSYFHDINHAFMVYTNDIIKNNKKMQGYSSPETYYAVLYFDNDRNTYDSIQSSLNEMYDFLIQDDDCINRTMIENLESLLIDLYVEKVFNQDFNTVQNDLINQSYNKINFNEIAEEFVNEFLLQK